MRLVYLTPRYPELTEYFVSEEARALVGLGHSIEVIAPYRGNGTLDGAPPALYFDDITRSRRMRSLAWLAANRPGPLARGIGRRASRMGASPVHMAALAPFAAAAAKADHIHAHFATAPTTFAAQLSALSGTPFSFTAHAYDIFLYPDRLGEKLERCKIAITVSDYNRRYLAELHPEHAHKLRVARYGVDVGRFARTRPYDPDGPLLAVGRLVPKKGFPDLVRAAAAAGRKALPEVLIAGDGPQREELEQLIEELDAPVRLLGSCSHDEINDLYQRASALSLPCVVAPDGDRDGVPLVIKEAMATELPFIGTRAVAIPEDVPPDGAVLVDPHDWQALGDALARFYSLGREERRAMGVAAREHVLENFTLEAHARQLSALFSEKPSRARPQACA
jgi:colanic acid/amylovoran biosynthesis glycosyltransferase